MHEYLLALIGGGLIGLSASLLLLFHGRIFGITGILTQSVLAKSIEEKKWRIAIVLGLMIGSFLLSFFVPSIFTYEIPRDYPEMIIAGLLVGFGTRLGSGCTSGHGVCGLPRLSLRSVVATLNFMFFAIITVYILGVL